MKRRRKVWVINPDIVARYTAGQTCQRIADVYGVNTTTISRALKSAGIEVVYSERHWTDQEGKLALRLKLEGRSTHEVAHLMGRSEASVRSKIYRLLKVRNPEAYLRRRGVDYSEAA